MDIFPPTDWLQHPVHLAVLNASLRELAALHARGADMNENIRHEGTPLHLAVTQYAQHRVAYEPVIRLLLDCRVNVNIRQYASGTPLHLAARLGLVDAATMLLDSGADINSKEDDQRRTPLHYAAYQDNPDIVQYLLDAGACVDAIADKDLTGMEFSARRFQDIGLTPLHIAAREGNLHVVQCLMSAGASWTRRAASLGQYESCGANAHDMLLVRRKQLSKSIQEIDRTLPAFTIHKSALLRIATSLIQRLRNRI